MTCCTVLMQQYEFPWMLMQLNIPADTSRLVKYNKLQDKFTLDNKKLVTTANKISGYPIRAYVWCL